MGLVVESAQVGCKVLPICDAGTTGSTCSGNGGDVPEKGMHKGDKKRVVSRMKELWRWAATARSSKGDNNRWKVLQFRKKGQPQNFASIDEESCSPKTSFIWEVGSCSASSTYSPMSVSSSRNDLVWAKHISSNSSVETRTSNGDGGLIESPRANENDRRAYWIKSDSEFVVLEL